MAFFFFFIGAEVKKEILVGDMCQSKVRNTVLMAAFGGVIIPILIYLVITFGSSSAAYWGIPTATDTAFSLGILWLFKKKIPSNLFSFFTAFSVIDDLLFNIILTIFYNSNTEINHIYYLFLTLLLMVSMNIFGIRHYFPYLIGGCVLWCFIQSAGIHGILSGILTAFCVPFRPYSGAQDLLNKMTSLSYKLKKIEETTSSSMMADENKYKIVKNIEMLAIKSSVPLIRMQRRLEPIVFLVILPFFAFINSGVPISLPLLKEAYQNKAAIGVCLALVLGKFIGVNLFTLFSIKIKLGVLPKNVTLQHIVAISLLAGIGFTMSIFIGDMIVTLPEELRDIKTGILFASIFSAFLGSLYLYFSTKKGRY